jgi:hypothetical protein
MELGENLDAPKVVNLVTPQQTPLYVNGVPLDMNRVAEVAEHFDMQKGDVLSIGGYRNAKGEWVPDYTSARIEHRAEQEEEE